jgi:3-oxoacyl-[acyl-carrier protein] reductase
MDASRVIDSFRMDGRVAVVTGAGSGIGRASALALAGAGATVVCADRDAAGAGETVALIGDAGGTGEPATVDVAVRAEVDGLAARTVERHGGIHAWANIAGIMVEGPFLDAPEDDLDRILAVNLKGTFFGCQAAGRVMVAQEGGGSIINTSSAAADVPSPNVSSYAICKAGVVQLTRSMAYEVGRKGVRVNAVAPGFVLTSMTGRYFVRPDGTVDEEMQEAVLSPMRKATPLRAIGEPEDIAGAVLYLASEASRFVTGQVVRPNGGVAMA